MLCQIPGFWSYFFFLTRILESLTSSNISSPAFSFKSSTTWEGIVINKLLPILRSFNLISISNTYLPDILKYEDVILISHGYHSDRCSWKMIRRLLSNMLSATDLLYVHKRKRIEQIKLFDKVLGYEGIKRTFVRSLNSEEPVHLLLVGPPGQAKTMFLKCILEAFGDRKAFFTVGGNASKSGLIDVLFELHPKYLLIDEIEHLKREYQTALLSLMETGILTQTMHSKVRHTHLKTWIFATSNGTKKLSEPLLSRFRIMYLNGYEFSQFYEIAVHLGLVS